MMDVTGWDITGEKRKHILSDMIVIVNLQFLSKTTLEITYRDSVAIDSTVVYKVR